MRSWLFAAALNGFLAVAAGAFAAHGLSRSLSPEALGWFETGARYHAYHALALLAISCLARLEPYRGATTLNVAGWGFLLGVVLFSGSLYAMALTGVKAFAFITPLGGIAFLAGWGGLAALAIERGRMSQP
jgi:uncharacterized membrane protein YgdD (TMEM256/DUF423 family)